MTGPGVKATVRFVSDDLFLGITPSGHALPLDTDSQRSSAPSPVELLLVALGACAATDVAGILVKKRQHVTSYVVEVTGTRRDEYPRSYTSMNVRHILTGKSISPQAVAHAIELSETKYCSVAATLRPTVEIQSIKATIQSAAGIVIADFRVQGGDFRRRDVRRIADDEVELFSFRERGEAVALNELNTLSDIIF